MDFFFLLLLPRFTRLFSLCFALSASLSFVFDVPCLLTPPFYDVSRFETFADWNSLGCGAGSEQLFFCALDSICLF